MLCEGENHSCKISDTSCSPCPSPRVFQQTASQQPPAGPCGSVCLRVRKLTPAQDHTLQTQHGFPDLCTLGGETQSGLSPNALVWERRQGKG